MTYWTICPKMGLRYAMVNYKTLYCQLMGEVSETIDRLIEAIRRAEDEYCVAEASTMAATPEKETE